MATKLFPGTTAADLGPAAIRDGDEAAVTQHATRKAGPALRMGYDGPSLVTDDTATRVRDLRSGTPVWMPHGEARQAGRPLCRGFSTDVAVIGGGITGALLADAALLAGKRVAVFDRRGLAKGSTPASTALLLFELDDPLTLLAQRIGQRRAARAWWRSAMAVGHLRGRISDLGLRCCFRERHTAYLPGNMLDVRGLRHEAELRARLGLRSAFVDGAALRRLAGIAKPGAIWSAGSGELDPVRLTRGLWRSAIARGALIHAPVDIADIDPGRTGVTLTTADGIRVNARHVVLATGYELPKMLLPRGYKVISTWAMATRPQRRHLWPSRCLIWEAADPYLYLRTTPDGRVLAGGEDEEFTDEARRDRLAPRKIAAIGRKLARLMPDVDTTPDFTWAGCFGISATGLPAIGPVPGARNCFAVLGFGGNGITFAAIAAQMFQRMLAGQADPDAELFGL